MATLQRLIANPVLLLALLSFTSGFSHADDATSLQTIEARYIEVNEERILDGIIEAVNKATVSAQTSGRVVEINYDVNDFVPKDAVLLQLRDTQQRANVDAAKAGLEEAESEYRRITELYDKKLVSKAELDRAEARRKSAQATMDSARDELDNTRVRAPYSGIVTERHIEVGETAQPGKPLFTGLSLESLRAVVQLPQSLINVVLEKRQARIIHERTQSSTGTAGIEATELVISPYADPASHTFMVRAMLPQGDHGLFPGMAVKVAFVTRPGRQLAVPGSAVVRRSEVSAVYVADDSGRFALRQVRTGRNLANNEVSIVAGLEAGERVAIDPLRAGVFLKEQQAGQ